jgi:hypothetical protein
MQPPAGPCVLVCDPPAESGHSNTPHPSQVKKAVPKPALNRNAHAPDMMGGGGGGGGGYGGAPPPLKLFVGGTGEITDDEFRSHFEVYGDMSDCALLRNADGTSRGFGFVTFTTDEVGRSDNIQLTFTFRLSERALYWRCFFIHLLPPMLSYTTPLCTPTGQSPWYGFRDVATLPS